MDAWLIDEAWLSYMGQELRCGHELSVMDLSVMDLSVLGLILDSLLTHY